MDSSIWVAVITGRPTSFAAWMIRFWTTGTCSIGICTPRSPRAIMTPSAAASSSSIWSTAAFRSILAITLISWPKDAACSRALRMSSARSMNEIVKVWTPRARPASISSRSRGVTASTGRTLSATFIPLREARAPPTTTSARISCPPALRTRSRTSPSLM